MFSPIFIITQQLLFWLSLVIFALPHLGLSQSNNDKVSIVERDGRNFTIFEHAATGVQLDFVTNSRICETTPVLGIYLSWARPVYLVLAVGCPMLRGSAKR